MDDFGGGWYPGPKYGGDWKPGWAIVGFVFILAFIVIVLIAL